MRFAEKSLYYEENKPLVKIFHSTVPSGKRDYREHHHTECELSLFKSGAGVYSLSDKRYEFKKGDVFLFGSDEPHCITDIYGDEKFDLINIHFEPRVLWSDKMLADKNFIRIFFDRGKNFENRIDRKNPYTSVIKDLIFKFENEVGSKKFNSDMMAKMYLVEIFTHLTREYGYINEKSDFQNSAQSLSCINRALKFIDDNLSDEISLDRLAKEAAMNKTYFSTVFKKFNGISPWEYIVIKRVEMAIGLLKSTELKKLEIAEQCGFNSASNFYKTFKKVTGKPPEYYCKKRD